MDVRVNRFLDQVTLTTRNSQDQIVKRAASKDIHVITGARSSARAEAIRLVTHLNNLDGHLRWIVSRHAPATIAHVAG